jgi:two-component system cell cycle response regulator
MIYILRRKKNNGGERGLAKIELLKQNLAIEPDLQNFVGFMLSAVRTLGGNPFVASLTILELIRQLREAGAGTGYPLPVELALIHNRLLVQWEDTPGGKGREVRITDFNRTPATEVVEQLRQHLQRSTEATDPAILLRRNAEMMRYLDETRTRTEREIEAMHEALAKRQEELWESVRQAETDPLTGLLNRRAFDERLARAVRRTLRQNNERLSLVLLDLDFFKQVNDEYGHQFGDAYLNKMAHSMRSVIRGDVDFAFRIGGDEFAMLLFADDTTTCRKAMQVLSYMDNRVSIGIATISRNSHPNEAPEGFFRRADDALYRAKRAGRGRVVADRCCEDRTEGCNIHCA